MTSALNLSSTAAARVGGVAEHLVAAFAWITVQLRAAARHQPLAADELRAMSDRDLRDLGIGRSEIPHVLQEDARRRQPRHW